MSSSNVSAILAELQAARADILSLSSKVSSLEAVLSSKSVAPAASSSAGKPVKVKTERKKSDAPPTAWRLFTDRIRGLLAANGYSGADLGVRCVQFCSSLKDENAELSSWADADVLARRSAWSPPEISKGEAKFGKGWAKTGERRAAAKAASTSGSVVSGDAELDAPADSSAAPAKKARKNPWEGLTPEQRAEKVAAMKAGRAAKKNAAPSSSDAAPTESAPAKTESAPPSPKISAAATSNVGNAAASSSSATEVAGPEGFKKVALNNKLFWVNLTTGHAYHRNKDQSQGDWAGLFSKTPKPHIDDSVPEPTADDDDAADDALVFDE
jgi:hypothetical protein